MNKKQITLDELVVDLESEDEDIRFSHSIEAIDQHVHHIAIQVHAQEARHMPELSIFLSQDAVDVYGRWHPRSAMDKGLGLDWGYPLKTWATTSAPVVNYFNAEGNNRLTIAFSDVLNPMLLETGGSDDSCSVTCKAKLFTEKTKRMEDYRIVLRLDTRNIPYYQSIRDVARWWAQSKELTPLSVPLTAKQGVFSSWYNYHQEITDTLIEDSCRQAVDYGFASVIVDDGWQTDNTQRGYGYCGDWEVYSGKIPDMASHVEKIHAMGLKYILWYAVPFIGMFTKAWERFQGKFLYLEDRLNTGVVDPRYPDVRDYLKHVYIEAIRRWKVDGFKLDFVNMFYLRDPEEALSTAPGKDYENV